MGLINNLNTPSIPRLETRLRNVESGSPMNNGGVGRDGFEVYDDGTINISNGHLIVNGTLDGSGVFTWTGSLNQSGTSTFTGKSRFTGQTDIWGPLTVTGDTDLDGKINISGAATLQSNLDVTGGGKIKIGAMTLSPSAFGGSVVFDGGASMKSAGPDITLADGANNASLKLAATAILASQSVVINSDSQTTMGGPLVAVSGQLSVGSLTSAPAGKTPNVYWDSVSKKLMVTI